MFFWRGNTNSVATSSARNLPVLLENFIIVNTDGINVTINVTIESETGSYHIVSYNHTLNTNQSYISDQKFVLAIGDVVKVSASDSVDFYFNFSNLKD